MLLEKRDEEVDRKHGVGKDLLLVHLDVADGDTEAENLREEDKFSSASCSK